MKISRKNISKKISDIRNPGSIKAEDRGAAVSPPEPGEEIKIAAPAKIREEAGNNFWGRIVLAVIAAAALIYGGYFLFSKYEAKKLLLENAGQKLGQVGLGSDISIPGSFSIRSWNDIEKLWPVIKGGVGAYAGLNDVANAALALSGDLGNFETAISANLSGHGNGETLAAIRSLNSDLTALREAGDKVDSQSQEIRNFLPISPDEYANLKYEARFWEKTSGNIADWLSSERNAVVFLENSSEMRPTGGFWGSYAELNIKNGDIVSTTVRDINEPDRTLKTKTIPPKQLQLITSNWKTADSNWFSNFPDSAATAKKFLDSSELYSGQGKKIDMIVAITPAVVADLLEITGPISVSSTRVAIDKDNFLSSIQDEVQSGQSAGSGQAKKILKDLFPAMMAKLLALGGDRRQELLSDAMGWIEKKDIMFWTEDKALESSFEEKEAAGSLFNIPQKFNGDYLSISAANIGGQKSDYMVTQSVNFESRINLDGTAAVNLSVTRKHNGKRGDKWWYLADNQAYLKIFLLDPGFSPTGGGGIAKTIYSPLNYQKSGYATDPLVSEIENSATTFKSLANFTAFKESGKTALATWVRTAAGKISTVNLSYNHRLFLPPADGVTYRFVFDKQPGINGSYDFNFTAPVGFVWAENNSPVYEYKSGDVPGRLRVDLTLKKD